MDSFRVKVGTGFVEANTKTFKGQKNLATSLSVLAILPRTHSFISSMTY